MKICSKCKQKKENLEFHKGKNKDGLRNWCKVCVNIDNSNREYKYKGYRKKYREDNKEVNRSKKHLYYLENKEKILSSNKNYRKTIKYRYISYKNNAKQRGFEFLLSEEEFYNIVTDIGCYYCGNDTYIGIDRKNSDIGYNLNNCVPCCSVCNRIKNVFEEKDFLNHVKRIYEYKKL